jgi:hypothetical protein
VKCKRGNSIKSRLTFLRRFIRPTIWQFKIDVVVPAELPLSNDFNAENGP